VRVTILLQTRGGAILPLRIREGATTSPNVHWGIEYIVANDTLSLLKSPGYMTERSAMTTKAPASTFAPSEKFGGRDLLSIIRVFSKLVRYLTEYSTHPGTIILLLVMLQFPRIFCLHYC